jgi:hypothetical protein
MYSLIHDCEKTLDPEITDLFEREANVFAAETMFQGGLFAEEAHQSASGSKCRWTWPRSTARRNTPPSAAT